MTDFTILPLTLDRWRDFEQVMGPRGAMQGCWCMWFRLTNADFNNMAGDGTREAMRGLVKDDCVPGLLAYEGETAVGWVSLAPREEFGRVERSKFFQKVDDERVWSIVCFYVPRKQRGKGLMTALLAGAIDFDAVSYE
ncbi:MAG: GNAT family N-acetyltransferase, partial [Dehalococcoidia bacterium]